MFFSYSVDITGNQRENRSYKENDKEGRFLFFTKDHNLLLRTARFPSLEFSFPTTTF